MVKIADSAAIRHHMPTGPRRSRDSGNSWGVRAIEGIADMNACYWYFQSGSSGCFASHSGRLLATTGSAPKLYSGGGDVVDHSSVQPSHGSFPAAGPLKYDQMKFVTQHRIPAA